MFRTTKEDVRIVVTLELDMDLQDMMDGVGYHGCTDVSQLV